ncbi:MAG: phosphoribosylformylglycinamidine cyclo-ligase [Deltaproteobacteria bacterium]|nr:phosphoribosylformylglycinamidine cyclo-ligase [Deltaproteobacteria bacterium]
MLSGTMPTRTRARTYAAAGVDIAAGDRLVRRIAALARSTRRPEIVAGVGGFAALARLPRGYRDPLLVTSTDGVGTKLRVAFALDRHDTVGIDLVAMSVNDLLTIGAEPLLFLDYFATGRLDVRRGTDLVRGIARGCRMAGCSLVGGETAEMPSFYPAGEYDLAGFAVGVVERRRLIDGRGIHVGDTIIALPSAGLHSNGFALARSVLLERAKLRLDRPAPGLRVTLGTELLRPTRIYVSVIRDLLRRMPTGTVRGMAHITGGGLPGNLPRILPAGRQAVVRRGSWRVPPIFGLIERLGRVPRAEMDRTFNNGVGFVLIVAAARAARVLAHLRKRRTGACVIGSIARGTRGLTFIEDDA